ncbi:MAG: phosphatidylserine/phosphatidylglycerophosphate/cardiolipin synthase family protein [Planctomycetes bacterium]|nr:phosphatidylserine/phosphatidylglycerophosphate/cardiolipin synthase family protein [Planctomycetota bacterium]
MSRLGVTLPAAAVAVILIGVAAAPARAQGVEGVWRIEATDDQGRPTAGLLRLLGAGPDLTYERHARPDLGAPVAVERGVARVAGGELLTAESATPGLAGALTSPPAAPGGAPATWAGRYRLPAALGTGAVAEGERVLGARRAPERLVRVDPAVAGNDVRLLIDGQAFAALRDDLASAGRSVDLQVFNWVDDATGRSLAGLLGRRAGAGVDVRCLVDARSKTITRLVYGRAARDFTHGLDEDLRRAGAEVVVQHGAAEGLRGSLTNLGRAVTGGLGRLVGRPPAPRESRGWKAHDHRKITVIDGVTGYIGGQNIAASYETGAWHDAQVRVQGPAVDALAGLFQDRWAAAGGRRPAPTPPRRAWAGDLPVEVVGSIPGLPDPILARLLGEVRRARREVCLEMAFLGHQESIDALQAAARRGVRVVVILPDDDETPDKITREAFRWVQNEVVRSGVELYKLRGRMLHAKLGTFDGALATIGSHNMSGSSLAESNVFIPDARFAREMNARLFAVDIPASERVEVERLTLGRRLTSFGARALRALF